MTPRLWMNKLNGQIVIAWPVIDVRTIYIGWGDIKVDHIGWVIEKPSGNISAEFLSASEQFYDIGEWE